MDYTGPAGSTITHAAGIISGLRKLTRGKYLVSDRPTLRDGKQFGHVTVRKAWLHPRRYFTEFSASSREGGPRWQGDLFIKYKYTCEGSYRYLERYDFCGLHQVFLLPDGVLKVHIIRDDGTDDGVLYWIKI